MRNTIMILCGLLLLGLSGCDLFSPEEEDPDPYTGGSVTNVQFHILSPTDVQLNWTEDYPDEDGFYVDRKLWNGAWEKKILQVGANTTMAVDTTAELGKVYYYKVYAFKGNQESEEEQVQYNFYLPAPQNLDYDFSWSQPNRMRLFWQNQAVWADSIVVARRLEGEQWTPHVAVLDGSATEYIDQDYNVSLTTSWGFTAYYQEHVSQQATLTMMPPKKEGK